MIDSSAFTAGINRRAALCAAILGVYAAVVGAPVLAADAANGKRVAVRWCAACHGVTADQRHAYADAPPFKEIANRPNFSEPGLVTFLLNPHRGLHPHAASALSRCLGSRYPRDVGHRA
jgi:mono/diheme cytochrome c family protein